LQAADWFQARTPPPQPKSQKLDAIQGHAQASEGGRYGCYPPDALKMEIDKHPRYRPDPSRPPAAEILANVPVEVSV